MVPTIFGCVSLPNIPKLLIELLNIFILNFNTLNKMIQIFEWNNCSPYLYLESITYLYYIYV